MWVDLTILSQSGNATMTWNVPSYPNVLVKTVNVRMLFASQGLASKNPVWSVFVKLLYQGGLSPRRLGATCSSMVDVEET